MKTCSKCNAEYPATSEFFYVNKKGKLGLSASCKTCQNLVAQVWKDKNRTKMNFYAKKWRDSNPEQIRRQILKRRNFTLELYNQMLTKQNGVCALCKTNEPGGRGTWHSDHDHKTGEPRGLLCSSCNTTLGHIESKPADWIDKAKKYINEGGLN